MRKLLVALITALIGIGTIITVAKTHPHVSALTVQPAALGVTCAKGKPTAFHDDCDLIFN